MKNSEIKVCPKDVSDQFDHILKSIENIMNDLCNLNYKSVSFHLGKLHQLCSQNVENLKDN